MNRPADTEQSLKAFFAAGPTQMPDRVFDAVFDQVERTPQRRLARLHLRFTDMSTTARLLAAGAAAVLVIGVGFAALGRVTGSRPRDPSVTVTERLRRGRRGPGPGRAPPSVPRRGCARAPTRPSPRIGRSSRSRPRTSSSTAGSSDLPHRRYRRGSSGLISTSDLGGCTVGDEGRYAWTLSPGGNRLTVVLQQDGCAARAAVVAGDWLRSDCPDTANVCLGPLEAGSYSSMYIDPFIPWDAAWRPRFGAIRYTVPDGWANMSDFRSQYVIGPRPPNGDAGIYIWSEIQIVSASDPCSEVADPDIGRSAQAMTDWLAHAAGVTASDPVAVTIGGLSGWRLDVSMDPTWTTTCPYSGGEPTRPLFTDPDPAPGLAWNLGPETRMRLFVLDLGDGRSLVVDIEGAKAQYDAILAEATGIVAVLHLPPLTHPCDREWAHALLPVPPFRDGLSRGRPAPGGSAC